MDSDDLKHTLKTVSVFARVQPSHKVAILRALQELGEVVSMSGDGVNDAPALKKAHVGIGMGFRGTDIAREASAMVLTDDNYSTIVSAIAEGRRIYDNIKKFVIFLVRCNLGEVLIIAGAMLIQLPLPLLPLHILWINLVTDSFPALALAAEPAEKGIMNRPPRAKGEGIFTGEWFLLGTAGVLSMILGLGIFALSLYEFPGDIVLARSAALTTSILFQLMLALSTRTKRPVFLESPFKNPWIVGAVSMSFAAQLVLLMSPLSKLFGVKPIPVLLSQNV
jgi:Ca2+-transporting ATPase